MGTAEQPPEKLSERLSHPQASGGEGEVGGWLGSDDTKIGNGEAVPNTASKHRSKKSRLDSTSHQ